MKVSQCHPVIGQDCARAPRDIRNKKFQFSVGSQENHHHEKWDLPLDIYAYFLSGRRNVPQHNDVL
jgi:hypothetical protein